MGELTRSHLDDIGADTPAVDLAKSLRFVAKWSLSPPHPVPLQEAARRLDQMAELESIVRALAASRINQATPTALTEARDRAKAWVEANPEATGG